MATIKCATCERFIRDSDRNCLYCNTPNPEYKEKEFGSFGSFGNSFSSGSFSGSFSDSGFKSSFDAPSTPTDFGVGKDFLEVDPYAVKPEEAKEPEEVIKPKAIKQENVDYEPSFAKTSLSNYLNSSSQSVFDEEPVVTSSMSSFFEPAAIVEDDGDELGSSFISATPVSKPKNTHAPSYTQVSPAVRKEKLDNYRKANGYGEYTPQKKMLNKNVLAKETYNPPRYDYGGGPIDVPDDSSAYGSRDRIPTSRRLNSSKQIGVGEIISFIICFYILQFVLKVVFFVLS